MTVDTSFPQDLNKAAAADAILCVGAGKTAYVGRLESVDWHRHGAPAFIFGLAGNFRLGNEAGDWMSCRAAVIPAGVRHALELGGDPLAVFYPEPNVATASDLARFGTMWDVSGRILISQTAEAMAFRELYEDRTSLAFAATCSMISSTSPAPARDRPCSIRALRAWSSGSDTIPPTSRRCSSCSRPMDCRCPGSCICSAPRSAFRSDASESGTGCGRPAG